MGGNGTAAMLRCLLSLDHSHACPRPQCWKLDSWPTMRGGAWARFEAAVYILAELPVQYFVLGNLMGPSARDREQRLADLAMRNPGIAGRGDPWDTPAIEAKLSMELDGQNGSGHPVLISMARSGDRHQVSINDGGFNSC